MLASAAIIRYFMKSSSTLVPRNWIRKARPERGVVASDHWRDVEAASEVFITNAVRGIRSVTELGALRWTDAPIADRLREALDF